MAKEIIKIAKGHRPLKLAQVKAELEKTFPQFEYRFFGTGENGLAVKKTRFKGARIQLEDNTMTINGRPPDQLASLIDLGLVGMISSGANQKIVNRLKKHLKRRYSS